jgi:hypothetical protein
MLGVLGMPEVTEVREVREAREVAQGRTNPEEGTERVGRKEPTARKAPPLGVHQSGLNHAHRSFRQSRRSSDFRPATRLTGCLNRTTRHCLS